MLELACAAGGRRRAPWAWLVGVALLAGIFPANVQMALDSGSGRNPGLTDSRVLAWGRLPLQLVMVWAVLEARQAPARHTGHRPPGPLPVPSH